MHPPAHNLAKAQRKEDPGQVGTELHQLSSQGQLHGVPWNLVIQASLINKSASYFLGLLRSPHALPSPPATDLEEPLLLSNLWLPGSHRVLREGHRGKAWMCGSQHRIDSSTYQRALLKGLMIQSAKKHSTTWFHTQANCHILHQCHWHITHVHKETAVFSIQLYDSHAVETSDEDNLFPGRNGVTGQRTASMLTT